MDVATVLYVEDDEQDILVMQHAWERAGLPNPLVIVKNGQECIDYLGGTGQYVNRAVFPMPHLVLLDLNLPKVPGLDLLRWIRAQNATRTLRLVVFSVLDRPYELEQARQLGANAYWVKPSDIPHFDEMIASVRRLWLDETPSAVGSGHFKLTTRMTLELPGELAQQLSERAIKEQKDMETYLLDLLKRELSCSLRSDSSV